MCKLHRILLLLAFFSICLAPGRGRPPKRKREPRIERGSLDDYFPKRRQCPANANQSVRSEDPNARDPFEIDEDLQDLFNTDDAQEATDENEETLQQFLMQETLNNPPQVLDANDDAKMPEPHVSSNADDPPSDPSDSTAPVFTTHEIRTLNKYKKKFDINIHPTERKWQCATCHKGGTSSDWLSIPSVITRLLDTIKSHFGLKKGRDAAKSHITAVKNEFDNSQIGQDLRHRERREAGNHIIQQLQRVAPEQLKQAERDAKILLQIATFIVQENLAIMKFVPIKQLVADLVVQVRRDPEVTWAVLMNDFNDVQASVDLLPLGHPVRTKLDNQLLQLKKHVLDALPQGFRDGSGTGVPARVTNGIQTNKLIGVVASNLLENILERVRNSPAFSIMIDESTDNSKIEQMTVNVIFVENGVKVSRFIGLIALDRTNADAIFDALITFLRDVCKLDFSRWYAFGSDGAAVMRGRENGVAAMITNELNHHFMSFHCASHMTALSAKSGAESSSLARALDALISKICEDFSRSTKMNAIFKDIQKMLNEVTSHKLYRVVPFHKIRWMSRNNTIRRLLKLLKPLLVHYENLQSSENHPRYHQLTNYSLLKFMFVLADILEPLRIITEASQKQDFTIDGMFAILDQQVAILESLKVSPQPSGFEMQFNNLLSPSQTTSPERWTRSMGSHVPLSYSIYGHTISYTPALEARVQKAKVAYIDTVLSDLRSRFADMKRESGKLDMFHRLLDISLEEVRTGSAEVATLYGENSLILENEINMARAIAKASGQKFKTFQEMAKFLLQNLPRKDYQLQHKFLSIVLVLPFSTADCERAFSKMNMIKSAKRNRLGDILRALMIISCARPEDLKLLNFDDMAKDVAHRVWQNKKSKFWASERYLMSIV